MPDHNQVTIHNIVPSIPLYITLNKLLNLAVYKIFNVFNIVIERQYP